ncbi:MAG TPA: hypothetical protein DCY64_12910 [Hydrogenophaga sp.]|jgi:hypothetical protein|nr:hypothetical protein [Gammaproteobacteria bacterium]OGA78989.1 MAG: hypothetical protein A2X73_13635 [Burkholderiales bacterium GWE1_65_30]OGA91879.1 MAG: hypothetical protein A2X72_15125 [Burkholderiales bacterium GWF1_66_17]OGB24652.1 MAG: hypothetical protein A3B67_00845 [Burkholderiales bacterium RIFCSPHIGHO2_02_FULL_66_10]PKO75744.1 MAG: hypothetical protein CVU21_16705 [Betaproteobacteria bacterium HGW-Betaproteobacteria-15]UCU97029.1 hypothetical protein KI616_12760 [Hydrogenophaga t
MSRQLRWTASALLLGGLLAFFSQPANAQGADIFKGADLALGEKMIAEHKCVACHVSKVGGDGSAMYKPKGKINSAGLLRGMVEMCNTTMNLGMFPEEVSAVAAVLNRDHYKFK